MDSRCTPIRFSNTSLRYGISESGYKIYIAPKAQSQINHFTGYRRTTVNRLIQRLAAVPCPSAAGLLAFKVVNSTYILIKERFVIGYSLAPNQITIRSVQLVEKVLQVKPTPPEIEDFQPGFSDFLELLGNSVLENLKLGARAGAAFGMGGSISGDFTPNLQKAELAFELTKGTELEWALAVSGTPFSSGEIKGLYQGVEFKAWGGLKIVWDYQGNWSITTSLAFPISHGGGVVSGYATTRPVVSENN